MSSAVPCKFSCNRCGKEQVRFLRLAKEQAREYFTVFQAKQEVVSRQGIGGKVEKKGLVVFDLDGTMGSHQGVPQANRDMLLRAGERGIVRVAATGRSLYSFFRSPFARLAFDHVVFSTGLGVLDTATKELSACASLTGGQISRVSGLLLGFDLHFCLHRPVPDNHSFFVHCPDSSNPDMENRLARNKGLFFPWPHVLPQSASQFLVVLPPAENHYCPRLRQALENEFSVIRATSPLDGKSIWVEIFPAGTCKSVAVAGLAEKYGLSRGDVLAVGNDYNDLDLLRWAGKSAVVGDSPPELLREFSVVSSCLAGGCAEAVSLWLEDRGGMSGY